MRKLMLVVVCLGACHEGVPPALTLCERSPGALLLDKEPIEDVPRAIYGDLSACPGATDATLAGLANVDFVHGSVDLRYLEARALSFDSLVEVTGRLFVWEAPELESLRLPQ